MLKTNISKENQGLIFIFLIGVVLRLIALPYTQVVDADAVSRIFIAEDWIKNPTFYYEGVWLPLHHYFNAFAIAISGEHIISPKIFHLLLSCFTIFPLYHFTKRTFSEKGAWLSALLFILCPVVFRNSFHALSGIPNVFFLALSLNLVSKSIINNKVKDALWAGFFITIASGFRYESWLLTAILFGVYWLFNKRKLGIYFLLIASIFPLYWMIGNYFTHDQLLFGVPGNYNEEVVAFQNRDIGFVEKIKRVLYFPFIWVYNYSPILVGILLVILLKKTRSKSFCKSRLIWSLPFWFMLIIFGYKAVEGTLLLQNRFSILLIFLSAPFASLILENNSWNKCRKMGIGLLLLSILPLSYIWMKIPVEQLFSFSEPINKSLGQIRSASQNTFLPIPRLWKKEYLNYSQIINENIKPEDGLILDFTSWDHTYFLAYNSQLPNQQIRICNESETVIVEKLQELLKHQSQGVLLLNCHSNLFKASHINGNLLSLKSDSSVCLQLKLLVKGKGMNLFKYQAVSTNTPNNIYLTIDCPEENSLEHIINTIENNDFWINDIRRIAHENKVPFEKQLEQEAQWIVDQQTK